VCRTHATNSVIVLPNEQDQGVCVAMARKTGMFVYRIEKMAFAAVFSLGNEDGSQAYAPHFMPVSDDKV
jgi:hypothetical protein